LKNNDLKKSEVERSEYHAVSLNKIRKQTTLFFR
jgi:hypothetical protein